MTRKRLRGDAAQWFVEFRDGTMDAQRREMFDAWLRTSPEHIRAYLEVSAFWADVPEAFAGRDIDVEAVIAAAREEDGVVVPFEGGAINTASNCTGERRGRGLRRAVALAACLLISMMIGVSWVWSHRGIEYQTDIGEQRSIVLSDGSTMDLNVRSRVQIRFEANVRNITLLEGQALFKVAKDASRPFIVDAGNSRIRAVGTQFDVYRRDSGTTVTVVEGRVAILASSEASQRALPAREQARAGRGASTSTPVEVAAGEQVKVAVAGEIGAPIPTNAAIETAWTRRQIIFREAPLSDVVEEFNRYNRRQMTIEDPAVAHVLVSGIFSSRDPGALLRFLREMPMFVVDETGHQIRVMANPSLRNDSG